MNLPRPKKQVTAAELMAQLEKNEQFQQQSAHRESVRQETHRMLSEAERPIVADLWDVGCEVGSVWDLVNTREAYAQALPILMAHLRRGGYPDRVMESLGRALAVRPANLYFDELVQAFKDASGLGEREGLAVAIAGAAQQKDFDKLRGLVEDQALGNLRIVFLRPLLHLGGAAGTNLVRSFAEDKVLGLEASALLRKRKRP